MEGGSGITSRIGIFTFNAVGVQYYSVKLRNKDPVRIMQSELEDPCGCLPEGEWLFSTLSCRDEVNTLVDTLPSLLRKYVEDERQCLGYASIGREGFQSCLSSSGAAVRSVQQALSPQVSRGRCGVF